MKQNKPSRRAGEGRRGRSNGTFERDLQYRKFCAYGFLKNLRFFEPFLLLFFLEKGLSFLEIGTLYAIREICTNILEIPTGVVADAVGRRRSMVFSFTAYIISFAAFYFAAGFGPFIGAMVLFSFGEAFRTGTHKAMIFEYLRIKGWTEQKVFYYGHTRSWSQIGSAVSSVLAMGLVFWRGTYASIFLFSIIPYIADLILMLTYPKELDGERRSVSGKTVSFQFVSVVKDFITSFKDPTLFRAIANLALPAGFYKAAKDYLQPLLKTLALSLPIFLSLHDTDKVQPRTAVVVGLAYALIYVLTSGAARNAGRYSKRFRRIEPPLNITLFLGAGLGAVSGVFYLLGIDWAAVVVYVGIYLVQNLRKPIGIAYVSDRMQSNILATALSAESQAETLFSAIIALLLGFAADRFGIATGIVAVSMLVGLASLFVTAKPARTPAQSGPEK